MNSLKEDVLKRNMNLDILSDADSIYNKLYKHMFKHMNILNKYTYNDYSDTDSDIEYKELFINKGNFLFGIDKYDIYISIVSGVVAYINGNKLMLSFFKIYFNNDSYTCIEDVYGKDNNEEIFHIKEILRIMIGEYYNIRIESVFLL